MAEGPCGADCCRCCCCSTKNSASWAKGLIKSRDRGRLGLVAVALFVLVTGAFLFQSDDSADVSLSSKEDEKEVALSLEEVPVP